MAQSAYEKALAYANEDTKAFAGALPDQEGQFVKGVRAGTYGMGSSLRNVVGAVGDSLGAEQFATGQYQEADRLAQQAGLTGPRVSSYKDVNGLRDAYDYGMGILGQTVPSAAVGIVPGLGAAGMVGRLGAATAAYTPLEMGDTVAKMRGGDPNRHLTAEDTLRAAGTGLVSAGAQSIVPAMVGGKIAGAGAQGAVGQGFKKTMARNLVGEGAIESLSEGGSEALKQFGANPNAPIDWEQVKENAVAGAVGGAGMGAVGGVADYAHAAPRNTWIGAKNLVGSATGKVGETLDPAWEGLKTSVGDGIAWARGKVPEGVEMPQTAKDVAEFTKSTLRDQVTRAKEAYKSLTESEDVPAAIKAQAKEWYGNIGSSASRASLWAAEQVRRGLTKTRDAMPENFVSRMRSLSKPVTDMADTILGSDSMQATKEFAGKTTDEIKRITAENGAKYTEWARNKAQELSGSVGLSDEHRRSIEEGLKNITERSGQMKIASVDKALRIKEKTKAVVSASYNKIKAAYDKMYPGDGKKRSEDFEGFNRLIYDRVVPLIEDRNPEFLEDDSNLQKLGGALRMFMQAAADGKDLRVAGIHTAVSDMLGPDLAHEVLNDTHEFVTLGDKAKVEKLFDLMRSERDDLNKTNAVREVIRSVQSAQAPGRTGVNLNADELAKLVMSWARGEHTQGKTRAEVEYMDAEFKHFLNQHFGADAAKVLRAAEKQATPKEGGKKSSKVEALTDSESRTGELSEKRLEYGETSETEASTYYLGAEGGGIPRLYQSSDTHKIDNPDYGHDAPVDQQLKRSRAANPDSKVHFVSARDYGRAMGMSEGQLRELTGGKDPGSHGFIKIERLDDSDALQPHELRRMRGKIKGAEHPDAITVEGRSDKYVYDSKRIAQVMHRGDVNNWTDFENTKGWATRLANKFAEGIAKLTDYEGAKINVRPDHVIGLVDNKDFTWGEAQELLKRPGTVSVTKADAEARAGEQMYEQVMKNVPAAERESALLQAKADLKNGEPDLFSDITDLGRELRKLAKKQGMDQRVATEQMRSFDSLDNTELRQLSVKVDSKVQAMEDVMANEVAESMRSDKRIKGKSRKDWVAEFVRRINDMKQNYPVEGYVEATELSKALGYEQKQRSGEDTRSRVLDAGQETRDGITLNPISAPSGAEGLQRAVNQHVNNLQRDTRRAFANTPPGDPTRITTESIKAAPNVDSVASGSMRREGDPEGNIHDAAATVNKGDLERNNTALRGQPANRNAVLLKLFELEDVKAPMAASLRKRLEIIANNMDMLSRADQSVVNDAMKLTSLSDIKTALDPIVKKYAGQIMAPGVNPTVPKGGLASDKGALVGSSDAGRGKGRSGVRDPIQEILDRMGIGNVVKEGRTRNNPTEGSTPNPKAVAAKKAAFLEKVISGDQELLERLSKSDDAKGLQRALDALLAYEGTEGVDNVVDAADVITDRLSELVQNPDVAYGLQTKKYSMQAAQAATNPNGLTAKGRAAIMAYIRDVLGNSVLVNFPHLPHAGEFGYDPQFGMDVVSVSVHALNPLSTAYHESLHAFFKQLMQKGLGDVANVLTKAASAPGVMAQLKTLLAGHPDALNQLSDPEERAAYMYQFWANGDLKLGEKATTIFGHIKELIMKALGIWTNDARALHIMEYFSTGEYAKNIGSPSAVHAALMKPGRNTALETLKGMGKPLLELGEAVFGAGSANLRDSGIPALAELADLVKTRNVDDGSDAGYLPAARIARSEFMNRLAPSLSADKGVMHEALEALQNATVAVSPEARAVQVAVRKTLDDMYAYLQAAGVRVNDLGLGKDYFPRQWDAHYLSTAEGKDAFFAMAKKYPQWANPQETYFKIIGSDGSPMPVVDRPGFDSKKERMLSFISHADAAPFMNKDLTQTVNNYVTQATRRAEWARRFGDDNKRMGELLTAAKQQGASDKQLDQAKQFVAGVNGTLGDDLNPVMRRYMGNMIVYQNIRLLPLAIFSSVVDPMGVMVRGGSLGDAWATLKRGIKEIPKGLKGDISTDAMTSLAQDLDVIDNAMLQHSLGALYTQGVTSDNAKKINDTFFRFNLMEQFGRSMRVGATEAALKFMVKHADAKASPHSARWMAELGLQAGDVKVVNGRMATSVNDGLTPEQAARVKVAVNRWVDGAVLRPDAADKPVWMNDPHFMLISHLKQFVYSFQHTILERVMHEARNGNYTPAMALSSYVPIMLAADMVKGLLQGGGDEPEWKKAWGPGEYFMNATERAGLFGVGQFGVEVAHGNFGALSGPTIEQLAEGVQVLGGSRQFKTFALHSLPANSVYATMAREGRNDTFDNPE